MFVPFFFAFGMGASIRPKDRMPFSFVNFLQCLSVVRFLFGLSSTIALVLNALVALKSSIDLGAF